MDEPTVGIDPQSRRHILDNVKALNHAGMTVLYTTHYMEEAAELSHHIAIMDQGQIIAEGTYDELIKLVGEQARVTLGLNTEADRVLPAWQAVPGVARLDAADGRVTALVDDSNRVLPRLFEAAAEAGARITAVDIQEPNLEAVFLHLTGRALRD
jgi:ABC-2 type transport system ATP-binding protein